MAEDVLPGGLTILALSAALAPAAVAANTTADQTFPLPGIRPGDMVLVEKRALDTQIAVAGAFCVTPDVVTVRFINAGAGSQTCTAETYFFRLIRG